MDVELDVREGGERERRERGRPGTGWDGTVGRVEEGKSPRVNDDPGEKGLSAFGGGSNAEPFGEPVELV